MICAFKVCMDLLEIPAFDGIVDRQEILCRFCRFLLAALALS